MSRTLRPLVPPVAAALLCTVLLAALIRAWPLALPPTAQVVLGVGLLVVVAVALALVRRVERDGVGQ